MQIQLKETGDDTPSSNPEFTKTFQENVIKYLIDLPKLGQAWMGYLEPDYFTGDAHIVYLVIESHFNKTGTIPSRETVVDELQTLLTVEDPYEGVLKLASKPLDPRDEPYIRERIVEWAEKQAYGKIFSEQAIAAHEQANYDALKKIINDASTLRMTTTGNCAEFFQGIDEITKPSEQRETFTLGVPEVDNALNNGGPQREEVVGFLGATGAGKSLVLGFIGLSNLIKGYNVLHISLEMPKAQLDLRYATAISRIPTTLLSKNETANVRARFEMKDRLIKFRDKEHLGQLHTASFPPNISIDDIRNLIQQIEGESGTKIDVLVLDYLEKMGSRFKEFNRRDEYERQKHVAVELFELTKELKICTFTATQTNREGYKQTGAHDLSHAGGSYDKMTPIGYWIDLQRTEVDMIFTHDQQRKYKDSLAKMTGNEKKTCDIDDLLYKFFTWNTWTIIKNRSGPEGITALVGVNYLTAEFGYQDSNIRNQIVLRDGIKISTMEPANLKDSEENPKR